MQTTTSDPVYMMGPSESPPDHYNDPVYMTGPGVYDGALLATINDLVYMPGLSETRLGRYMTGLSDLISVISLDLGPRTADPTRALNTTP